MPPTDEQWLEMVRLLTEFGTRQEALILDVREIKVSVKGNGKVGLESRVDRLEIAEAARVEAEEKRAESARASTEAWKTRLFYPLLLTALVALGGLFWLLLTHQAAIVLP